MSQDYNLVQGQARNLSGRKNHGVVTQKLGALLGLSHQRMERITPFEWQFFDGKHDGNPSRNFRAMRSVGSRHDHWIAVAYCTPILMYMIYANVDVYLYVPLHVYVYIYNI